MRPTNNSIEHMTWGNLSEGYYYSKINTEITVKTVAFLAAITPKDIDDNLRIDFDNSNSYKKGLKKLYKHYSELPDKRSSRIANLLIYVEKAIELNFEVAGKLMNRLYESYCKEDSETLCGLYDYMEQNVPTGMGINSNITNDRLAEIVRYLLKSKKNSSSVLDIACGRGVFLSKEAQDNKDEIYYGCDPVFINTLLTSMRLEIQNVDYEIIQDSILNGSFYKQGLRFDKVFADFPWMVKTSNDDMSYLKDVEMPVAVSNRSDWKFANMAINLMSKNGKAVIIMNEGSLFNQLDEKSREFLIEKGLIESIISMPSRTRATTNIPYSLMVLSHGNKTVKFIDATNCYFDDMRERILDVDGIRKLCESDTTTLEEKRKGNKTDSIVIIDKETIKKQNYILSIGRYIEANKVTLINPTALKEVCKQIYRGYQATSAQIQKLSESNDKKEYELLQLSNIDENGINDNLTNIAAPSNGIDKFLLKENDIIISTKSLNVKVAVVKNVGNRKIIPTGSMIVVRADESKINPVYLYVFLSSNTGKTKLTSIQTGTVIMSINANALEKMEVSNPDEEIQKNIADRYDQLRFNYEVAMKQVRNAKQKIDSLYEEEVGDLD